MKHWPKLSFEAIARGFLFFLFVFSLPLLLLALAYASETVFWSEGPQTDYPLLGSPRPDIGIRIHGLLCLVSSLALTLASGTVLTKNTSAVIHKPRISATLCFACLIAIWWNPWHSGSMDSEERTLKLIVSTPILLMLILTGIARRKFRQISLTKSTTTTLAE
ncbi:MAG: hypothetical protein ACK5CT_10735 [Bacteroidota bacterium]